MALRDVPLDLGLLAAARHQLVHQRMLRRQDEEGGPEERVRPGGEDGDLDAAAGRQPAAWPRRLTGFAGGAMVKTTSAPWTCRSSCAAW